MKLCKYYSLDECKKLDLVLDKLDSLQDDSKIEYILISDDEVIKIKSNELSLKERKELVSFFKENDVIDYPDYEELDGDDDDDLDEEDEEDEYEY
jgi:ABC-type microcin C transport system duplicated ATPase subunit YejF